MPGVPGEMKGIMENSVLPELKKKFALPPIVHKTILTQGIGESMLAEKIERWEDALPSNLKLAYLPSTGMVRLRLTGHGTDEIELRQLVEEEVKKLLPLISNYVYGEDDDKLEELTGRLLRKQNMTLATAESCTGGSIASRIVSIPGSSDYYRGSVVAYANQVKSTMLGIPPALLLQHGAVSEEVVKQMAINVREILHADFGIATSGVAGPSGGSDEKPVGTVWLAVSGPEQTITRKLQLGSMRDRIIIETGNHAFNELRKMLSGD
jgi:nicotinamide-nucleotide amidase